MEKNHLGFRSFVSGTWFALLLLGLMPVGTVAAVELKEVSRAVVKLFITRQGWNMRQPWSKNPAQSAVCSGFLIDQGVLTNAHCIADATYIQMEIPGVADKVGVHIIALNHQVDLALLKSDDEGVFGDIEPIVFGDLPQQREKVVTIGYPIGGRQVSFTEGVVSRIDMMRYVHSRLGNLMVQTDAAINSGNSGGPVFSDESGACLGVATQKGNGSSIGYFVPVPVVKHFLTDIADGAVDGVPALGVFIQTLENPANRSYLRMADGQSGVRVKKVGRYSSAHGYLQPDDVLLTIDGHTIFNDGRVPFRGDGKIGLTYYITNKQVGDALALRVLRQGRELNVTVPLQAHDYMVIPRMPQYDTQPRFYEIGGIIFRVVEPRYIGKNSPISIKAYWDVMRGEDDLQELVVIGNIFEDEVNKGYKGAVTNQRVLSVNGRTVRRLDDLVQAFAENKGGAFHVVELENHQTLVLDRAQVEAGEARIRARYNIRL